MNYQIKDIKDFPGYRIDTNSNVWSCKVAGSTIGSIGKYKILKQTTANNGYKVVNLYKNKKRITTYTHRIIAQNFLKNENNKPSVCHRDGNPRNNHVNNLYWGSQKDNAEDSRKHGKMIVGINVITAKLTEKDVVLIRELWDTSKLSQTRIGEIFGVCGALICGIVNNKRWKHILE